VKTGGNLPSFPENSTHKREWIALSTGRFTPGTGFPFPHGIRTEIITDTFENLTPDV
jgi:hypothetical protein